MTTKQYLAQGRQTEKRIQQQLRVLGRFYRKNMPVKTAADEVQSPGELQASIYRDFEYLLTYRRELESLIAQLLDQNHREILTMRYICGLRWEQISRRMHYSSRHLLRMHSQALRELEQCRSKGRRS